MKSITAVRKIDELGRLCLPRDLLRSLNIEIRDPIEILVTGESIILKKHVPGCSLCSYADAALTSFYPDKLICKKCVELIVREQSKLVFE